MTSASRVDGCKVFQALGLRTLANKKTGVGGEYFLSQVRQKFTPPGAPQAQRDSTLQQQLGQDTAPYMRHALISAERGKSQRRPVHIAVSRWSRGTPTSRQAHHGQHRTKTPRGGGLLVRESLISLRVRQLWGLLSFCLYKPRRSLKISIFFLLGPS